MGAMVLPSLLTYTDDGRPIVYLTFDDGPSDYTPQVLSLLARYDAQATFFVLGEQVEIKPDQIRIEMLSGHYVGSHSYDHTSLVGLSSEAFIAQMKRTEQAIVNATGDLHSLGHRVRYLRPPYGDTDATVLQRAADLGYDVVLWDVDSEDWQRPGAETISDYVLSNVFPGAIVLMHDGGRDCEQSVEALETVLRELSVQGYAFHKIVIP
jgi:peptidoglycan/xylan/chitin deacetylase (PgdA/CDA1 family)